MSDNLWPTDFGETDKKTPVGILREQAQALGTRTANIVVGRVTTETYMGKFRHSFHLWCSPLGFETPLFHIVHGMDLYPVEIFLHPEPRGFASASNQEEFTNRLKEIFSREETKKTIGVLLAQSKQ